jgi:hypothetical protein
VDGILQAQLLLFINSLNFVWLGILLWLFYPKSSWPKYFKEKQIDLTEWDFTELRREFGDDFSN